MFRFSADGVAGGGNMSDTTPESVEALADSFDQAERGRGVTSAAGVPGTMGLPVGKLAERITERARQIWEEEGRPDGRAEEHWLRAERELLAAPVAKAPRKRAPTSKAETAAPAKKASRPARGRAAADQASAG